MGVVYTPLQVQSNAIPSIESYLELKQLVESLVEGHSPAISGLYFGSVGAGAPGRRSDFDVLIYWSRWVTSYELIDRVMHFMHLMAAERRITLDPFLLEASMASSSLNTVGESFWNHLRRMTENGQAFGGFNVNLIDHTHTSARLELTRYLAHKIDRFSGLIGRGVGELDEVTRFGYYRKVSELVYRIARKFMAFRGVDILAGDEAVNCFLDELSQIPKTVYNNEVSEVLKADVSELLRLDRGYNEVLERNLGDNYNSEDYERYLDSFNDALPRALRFLFRVGTLLKSL